jgi:signal peptidase I
MGKGNRNRADVFELGRQVLKQGYLLRFRASGRSMDPFIRNGDVIEIKPIDISKVRIGDVILYRTFCGTWVVHRAIEKHEAGGRITLVIKGDAAQGSDRQVCREQVLGKVVAIERAKKGTHERIGLDNARWKLLNLLFAVFSSFSPWIYPVLRKAKCRVRRGLIGNEKCHTRPLKPCFETST